MNKIDEDVRKDIQYLIFKYKSYIDDIGGDPWKNDDFIKYANKYGFTKENLHSGLEYLCC